MFIRRMRVSARLVCFLAIAGLIFSVLPAQATLIIPSSERFMTQRADAIIMGTVVSAESRWNVDRSLIYTDIAIDVSRTLKSGPYPSSGRIVISVLGGTVDGITYNVDEQVEFENGEQVLLFLIADPNTNAYTTFAQYYGKYTVRSDAATGALIVDGPSFHRYQHYNPTTMEREQSVVRPDNVRLNNFISEINGYLGN